MAQASTQLTLEKLLQSQGFGTRRQCRSLINTGRVQVNQLPCDDPSASFELEHLHFAVDGIEHRYLAQVYLALHKPAGYECSHQPQSHPSVFSLLPPQLLARGTQAVGRLDFDTTGLLLLSDDGAFVHRCSAPKRKLSKTYRVSTKHPVTAAQIEALLAGVVLHDGPEAVRATACHQSAERELELTICEGKYHQVKRMLAAVGNRVLQLHRHTIGGYTLDANLAAGAWRWLEPDEVAAIEAGAQ